MPLIRLAMDVGLDKVAATAHRMGIESKIDEVPAMALGSAEVTPREIATVYSTLAAGGVRPVIHGIAKPLSTPRASRCRRPKRRSPSESSPPRSPTSPPPSSKAWSTAARPVGVRRYGVPGPIAGKTGTTNEAPRQLVRRLPAGPCHRRLGGHGTTPAPPPSPAPVRPCPSGAAT